MNEIKKMMCTEFGFENYEGDLSDSEKTEMQVFGHLVGE